MFMSVSVWLILALASAGPLRQVDAVAMTWRVEQRSGPEAGARSCRVISLGGDAAEIVALLKTPGEVVFEWGKRPDYSKRGGLFATGDFAAKAAQCERWIGETRI